MRLLAPVLAAAIFVPVAVWYRPVSEPAAAAEDGELPDRVLVALNLDQLPFGEPPGYVCDSLHLVTAVLVQDDALWLGDTGRRSSPMRIPRDGAEWAALEEVLRALSRDHELRDIQVSVHDDARYEDLLTAMLVADSLGVHPRVIQPALPSYPNHGWRGGMY